MPDQTADLVSLQEYIKDASSIMVTQLQKEVDESAERLLFLLDFATLPCKYDQLQLHLFNHIGTNDYLTRIECRIQ